MSDAFTDVAKMKKIKEEIKAHEGQVVEMTLENGRKRQKNKFGRLRSIRPCLSLSIQMTIAYQVNRQTLMLSHTPIQIF